MTAGGEISGKVHCGGHRHDFIHDAPGKDRVERVDLLRDGNPGAVALPFSTTAIGAAGQGE